MQKKQFKVKVDDLYLYLDPDFKYHFFVINQNTGDKVRLSGISRYDENSVLKADDTTCYKLVNEYSSTKSYKLQRDLNGVLKKIAPPASVREMNSLVRSLFRVSPDKMVSVDKVLDVEAKLNQNEIKETRKLEKQEMKIDMKYMDKDTAPKTPQDIFDSLVK